MLVSIVVPFYNSMSFLNDCINSVINQTYKDFELILVNDCSLDGSLIIANKYEQLYENVRVIDLKENKGVGNARNVGIEYSNGHFIAFLDSDDIWVPNKLEMQVDFMIKNNCSISFTSYFKFDKDGGTISKKISVPESVFYLQLLKNNVIPLSSAMIIKGDFRNLKFQCVGHEDFVYWLEALKINGPALGINQPLMYYRISSNSLSHNKFRASIYTWNIYRKIIGMNYLRAIYYFSFYIVNSTLKFLK